MKLSQVRLTGLSASIRPAGLSLSGSIPPTCTFAPTRSRRASGQSGRWQSEYHDVMIDHDKNVGQILALLDELGIANDTLFFYSTDNGPHMNSWPDAGMTPFRTRKIPTGRRLPRPAMVRWPGHIKPGSVSNEIVSHMDWLPTFLAMAGDADIQGETSEGLPGGQKILKFTWMATTCCRISRVKPPRAHARSSSTSRTMATCWLCDTTTGSSCSHSSG